MWSCGRPSCHCALTGDYLSYAESRVVTISRSYLNQIYSFYVGICCFSLEFISKRRLLFLSLWDRFYYPLQLSCSPWLSELGLAKALLLSSLCDCVGCSCRPLCVYRESQQCVYTGKALLISFQNVFVLTAWQAMCWSSLSPLSAHLLC